MKFITIGAISLAGVGLVLSACTRTIETRVVQQPAASGVTTVIQSNNAAPVTLDTDGPRDIIVHVD